MNGVIPAQAGIHVADIADDGWVPACAGTTGQYAIMQFCFTSFAADGCRVLELK
jgi:hypothetical protein